MEIVEHHLFGGGFESHDDYDSDYTVTYDVIAGGHAWPGPGALLLRTMRFVKKHGPVDRCRAGLVIAAARRRPNEATASNCDWVVHVLWDEVVYIAKP